MDVSDLLRELERLRLGYEIVREKRKENDPVGWAYEDFVTDLTRIIDLANED